MTVQPKLHEAEHNSINKQRDFKNKTAKMSQMNPSRLFSLNRWCDALAKRWLHIFVHECCLQLATSESVLKT